MSSAEFDLQLTESPRSRLGALIVFGAAAVAILATALGGVVLDNALGGRVRDRAVWGVLLMALGAAGPVVAVVVLVRRRQIVREAAERHWGAVAFFPGSFVAAWVGAVLGYGILGGESNPPIIPHTSKLIITFRPVGDVSFTPAGAFGGSEESRGVAPGGTTFAFRARAAGTHEIAIAFEGAMIPLAANGRVEVRGTLVLTRPVRLQVIGTSDAILTIDDQPREIPAELEPGSYQVVIRGTPRGE